MKYEAVEEVIFKERKNRFIATCEKKDGQEVTAHVKNTGRCNELLIPGATVALNYTDQPTRETKYDLIAAKKEGAWFNIDTEVPTEVVAEAIKQNTIKFDIIKGNITNLHHEYAFGDSRFSFLIETDRAEKLLLEIKSMTLDINGVGLFPDAPSTRALRQVVVLEEAQKSGYISAILYVAQFEAIRYASINKEMQPDLQIAIEEGLKAGLTVLAYNCHVTADEVTLDKEIPFKLT